MKTTFNIIGFTILVTAFYYWVGQTVPQKITYPPEKLEIRPDLTTAEMVEIGGQIVNGDRGTCQTCHGLVGGRFPDLNNVGAIAGNRKPGMGDVEYLAESIYEPNKYIVEGYAPGMPEIHKPPISLNDDEILTVIAYLQSLGGTPTVTMQTTHSYTGTAPPGDTKPPTATATGAKQILDGPALVDNYLCKTCHSMDAPTRMVGPSLYDVGARMSKAELYESIMDPDASVAEGFPPGSMAPTLKGIGFYEKVSSQELNNLVEYLASLKGGQ